MRAHWSSLIHTYTLNIYIVIFSCCNTFTQHSRLTLAFEGNIYQQVHEMVMGSPVLVVVANLVMKDIEQKALSTFHTPPLFWRRYVDDTCTVLPLELFTKT